MENCMLYTGIRPYNYPIHTCYNHFVCMTTSIFCSGEMPIYIFLQENLINEAKGHILKF